MKHLFTIFLMMFSIGTFVKAQDFQHKYFVMLNANPGKPELPKAEVDKIQAAHMANIDSLDRSGSLLAAGPFNGGGGLFVLVAASIEDARNVLNTDPAVKANRFIIELYPLTMNYGSICPVKGKYEMVEYQFIKYTPVKDKISTVEAGELEKLAKRHLRFLKETGFPVKYIAEGEFGPADGGFLIIEKTLEENMTKLLKYDPWAKSGYFTSDLKILWIAKGSFCE
jgi:uncharacterized protein YciI